MSIWHMDRHKQHYIITLFLAPCLLDHVRHRDFGVLLKHAGHQAVTTDIVDALKRRAEENLSGADATHSQSRRPSNRRPHLADVAGPRRFFLAGRSQEDDGERRTVGRLHHNLELQVVEALAGGVVWGRREKTHGLFPRRRSHSLAKQLRGLGGRVHGCSQSSSLASSSSMRVHSIRESVPPCCWEGGQIGKINVGCFTNSQLALLEPLNRTFNCIWAARLFLDFWIHQSIV